MRNDNDRKASLIFAVCGIVPVAWFAMLIAPYVGGGLVEIVQNLSKAIEHPFSITVCEDSLKTVLIFLLAYGMGIGIYLSPHAGTTAGVRNTALQNGATQGQSTKNIGIKTCQQISR